MGPTNVALVKLFEADNKLRDAKARLEAAAHNVRIQERRVNDLTEKLRVSSHAHKEQLAKSAQLDLELRARDQQIEKLRTQQQAAKNNKEYQALLVEINTRKVDKAKIEEQAMTTLEAVEKFKNETALFTAQLEVEKGKLGALKAESGDTLAKLQAEVDAIVPERESAGSTVPPKALDLFNRLADKYDGEAMSAIDRPDRRKEEYLCTACNMDLVRDIYNKLKNRDDVVFCPNCQRMLFIPEHFTAEHAIGGPTRASAPKKKVTVVRAPKGKKAPAAAVVAAAAEQSPAEKDVVVIEARASGALGRALSKAQGESVSRAIKSDTRPVEAEVYVDGNLAGIYKGISIDNLQRVILFELGEHKIEFKTVEVKPLTQTTDESVSAEEPTLSSAPVASSDNPVTALTPAESDKSEDLSSAESEPATTEPASTTA